MHKRRPFRIQKTFLSVSVLEVETWGGYVETVDDIHRELQPIQTEDGSTITISKKYVIDRPRTLGCYVAADGSWGREFSR